jgi:hypothetical protein
MKDSHHCIVDAINWNPFENATQFGQIVSEAAIEFLFLDL